MKVRMAETGPLHETLSLGRCLEESLGLQLGLVKSVAILITHQQCPLDRILNLEQLWVYSSQSQFT